MDQLFLNTIGFPVQRGTLSRGREELGDYCWEIEIYCDESPQLDYWNWPDDRPWGPDDWLAGTGLLLAAQRLPLRVQSPDELIGRDYLFPPTPEDDPTEWSNDPCWPYFFLYVWEGYPTEQLRVAFTGKQDRQYRVEITGTYDSGEVIYELRAQAWLDWLT
ncbi:MAG: hypothetical protein L0Z62_18395 [Gemmataceae bacterium]|nr:hypothetical protein [Gemmataceae bacterium]